MAIVGRGSIDNLSMSFEDLFCQKSAGGKILGEEMNEASILAKNLPFLSTELLRELEKLQVRRRFLHFRVSAHYRGSTMFQNPPFGELSLCVPDTIRIYSAASSPSRSLMTLDGPTYSSPL